MGFPYPRGEEDLIDQRHPQESSVLEDNIEVPRLTATKVIGGLAIGTVAGVGAIGSFHLPLVAALATVISALGFALAGVGVSERRSYQRSIAERAHATGEEVASVLREALRERQDGVVKTPWHVGGARAAFGTGVALWGVVVAFSEAFHVAGVPSWLYNGSSQALLALVAPVAAMFGGGALVLWGLQARRHRLMESVASTHGEPAFNGEPSVDDVAALLGDVAQPAFVRVAAPRYLGAYGGRAAMPAVCAVLEDRSSDWAVGQACTAALDRIRELSVDAPDGGLTLSGPTTAMGGLSPAIAEHSGSLSETLPSDDEPPRGTPMSVATRTHIGS